VCAGAFAPAGAKLQLSQVAASRAVDPLMMAKRVSAKPVAKKAVKKVVKKVAKKAPAPKRAPAGKRAPKKLSGTEGKGGIFPWVTNEPGTYAKVAKLSSFNFLGDDGNDLIGWGFMPNSVKALYNANGYKGLLNK